MAWLYLIGRILLSSIFLISGFGHFRNADAMAGFAARKGLPAPKAAVLLSGVMLLAGGASLLLGFWMEIGTWLLIVFLLVAAFTFHAYWGLDDPAQAKAQRAQFLKNLALAGGALIVFWLVRARGYGPFTLGGPL